jgi:hypothetical protein
MMQRILATLLIGGLMSCSVALADEMDGTNVIRPEHTARAADNAGASGAARGAQGDRASSERTVESVDELREAFDRGTGPTDLALDSLGLYFGLGDHFVDMANGLIDERMMQRGDYGTYQEYSHVSDEPLRDVHAHGARQRTSSDDGGDSGSSDHGAGLNRRGSDHDYFYD